MGHFYFAEDNEFDEGDELDEGSAFNESDEVDRLFEDIDPGETGSDHLAGVLRNALHEVYRNASGEEMAEALTSVFDAMSPAETFNVASALGQAHKAASRVFSDPAVRPVALAALPVTAGALGTVIGGPSGTWLGSQLSNAAASALHRLPPARSPVAQRTIVREVGAAPDMAVPSTPPQAPVARQSPRRHRQVALRRLEGGLVLTQQWQILQSPLAAALDRRGRPLVTGDRSLYVNLLDADHRELADEIDFDEAVDEYG